MEIALLLVLIVVLVISEYRHNQDRADYKELALNQQNHIKELLEIIRFRSGISAQTNQIAQPSQPIATAETTTAIQTNNSASTSSAKTEQPLGYMARIKKQEKELENAAQV